MSTVSHSPSELDTFVPPAGPPPHEDLTIAELLEIMRDTSQKRPDEQCFIDDKNQQRWVSDAQVTHFLSTSGALHPSSFLNTYGTDWKLRFFSGF